MGRCSVACAAAASTAAKPRRPPARRWSPGRPRSGRHAGGELREKLDKRGFQDRDRDDPGGQAHRRGAAGGAVAGAPEDGSAAPEEKVSDRLERWLEGEGTKTLGSLIELFGERSFAIVFVLLMAFPALPLPTGGASHVLEVVTMLLALELVVGRRTIWLPERWKRLPLAGESRQRLATTLLKLIRRLERFSRPRFRPLLDQHLSGSCSASSCWGMTVTAFVAPPFSGLDTLPSLGVVVLSLGFLMEDAVLAGIGLVIGVLGAVVVIGLGSLVLRWVRQLF